MDRWFILQGDFVKAEFYSLLKNLMVLLILQVFKENALIVL